MTIGTVTNFQVSPEIFGSFPRWVEPRRGEFRWRCAVVARSSHACVHSTRASDEPWVGRLGGPRCFWVAVDKRPERRSGASDARHQRAHRNCKRRSRFGIAETFDGNEMESRTLLVRQLDERFPDLAKTQVDILHRRNLLLEQLFHPSEAANFRAAGARSINENVVQDRHEPNPQIVSD